MGGSLGGTTDRGRRIVIAGGGLAGLACGLLAAKRGKQVCINESAAAVGGRFGGGFQILENFTEEADTYTELATLGLSEGFEIAPAHYARFFLGGNKGVECISGQPFAYFVRRGDVEGGVDRAWAAELRALGGAIEFSMRGSPVEVDVVATGPQPPFAGMAREHVFRCDHLDDRYDVFFDDDFAPRGYGYCFIIRGEGTAGIAMMGDFRLLGTCFERFKSFLRSRMGVDTANARTRSYGMSFFLAGNGMCLGQPIRIGEAGGYQDMLFGLANRLAVRSAAAAAEFIAGEDPSTLLESLRHRQLSSVLSRMVYGLLGPLGSRAFVSAVSGGDFRDRLIAVMRYRRVYKLLFDRLLAPLLGQQRTCEHRLPGAHWCWAPRAARGSSADQQTGSTH